MPEDFELICKDKIKAIQEAFELEKKCRDIFFIDDLKHYLLESAWFNCIVELGIDVFFEGKPMDKKLAKKGVKCLIDAFEMYAAFDDKALSKKCLKVARAEQSKAGDNYWKCIHKYNQKNPP